MVKVIKIECLNAFRNDDRVVIKTAGDKDLIFFSDDDQLVEVVKARVGVALKTRPQKKIIIQNNTKGKCKISLSKFASRKRN